MTPAATIRQTADIIREGGWCQGKLRDGTKRCLAGAMADLDGPVWVQVAASNFIVAEMGTGCWGKWNDDPARTVDEVLEMLERAAKRAEA